MIIIKIIWFVALGLICSNCISQTTKVAILDFENTSGIAKYDGLGKAMSSMLITDIASNVSPKRLQLVERSQIQKILKEQNFQATSAVDKTSSVKAGKLLGVKYLLVGDIYILNDVLVINARLTDTETGDIKFSKKQEGKLVGWLKLGSRNYKKMREYLNNLIELLDYPFYDFVQSEYYYEMVDKKIPIFNPYDVLGTLIVLVGNDNEKQKSHKYFELHKEKNIYRGTVRDQSWYNNDLTNGMLILNATPWANSKFEDFKNKNWTDLEFDNNLTVELFLITIKAICLSTSRKYVESYFIMDELKKTMQNKPSLHNEKVWAGIKLQSLYYIIQMRNSIALGKIDDVKYISRQLGLLGIDPYTYSDLHTEFYD